jgi:hypothetical protein
MLVELLPGKFKADGYPVISSLNSLLVRCDDPIFIKMYDRRWDNRKKETYRIIEVEPYEQRFIRNSEF